MLTYLRIGFWLEPTDAFWVQIREAFYQRSKQLSIEIVPISSEDFPLDTSPEGQHSILEDIIALELDVLVGWYFPEQMAYPLLEAGLPIVHLGETDIEHSLSVSMRGLKEVAWKLAQFFRFAATTFPLPVDGDARSGRRRRSR